METLSEFEKRIRRSNTRRLIWSVVIATLLISFTIIFKFGSVQSESMLPNLVVGDCVIYNTAVNFNSIDIGDIILYRTKDDRLIIHRVIETEQVLDNNGKWVKQYIVQGDNNSAPDSTHVTKTNFVGKVEHVIQTKAIADYIYAITNQDRNVRIKAVQTGGLVFLVVAAILFTLSMLRDKRIDKRRKEIMAYYGLTEDKKNIAEKENIPSNLPEAESTSIAQETDIIEEMNSIENTEESVTINITTERENESTIESKQTNTIAENVTAPSSVVNITSYKSTKPNKNALLIAGGLSVAIITGTLLFKYIKERS